MSRKSHVCHSARCCCRPVFLPGQILDAKRKYFLQRHILVICRMSDTWLAPGNPCQSKTSRRCASENYRMATPLPGGSLSSNSPAQSEARSRSFHPPNYRPGAYKRARVNTCVPTCLPACVLPCPHQPQRAEHVLLSVHPHGCATFPTLARPRCVPQLGTKQLSSLRHNLTETHLMFLSSLPHSSCAPWSSVRQRAQSNSMPQQRRTSPGKRLEFVAYISLRALSLLSGT